MTTLLPLVVSAAAALVSAAPAQHHVRAWRTGDGLATPTVQSLVESRRGYLVLGLHGEVVRFDGVRFTDLPGLPRLAAESQVRKVYEDIDGSLWIATMAEGLFHLGPSSAVDRAEGLPTVNVADVCRDGEGTLWVGTTMGLVYREPGASSFRPVPSSPGRASPASVVELACERAGVWVAPGASWVVRVTRDGRAEEAPGAKPFPAGANAVHVGPTGTLWVGATAGGLVRVSGTTLKAWQPGGAFPVGRAMAILEEPTGAVWYGSWTDGLARIDERGVVRMGLPDGLVGDSVTSLAASREGGVWVGTTAGLGRIEERPFRTLALAGATRTGLPSAVFAARDGTMWVGFDGGGLAQLNSAGLVVRTLRSPAPLPSDHVLALAERSDGALLVATQGGSVVLVDGGRRTEPAPRGFPLLSTRKGQFILHESRTIVRAAADGSTNVLASNIGWPARATESADGILWLAHPGGLATVRAGVVENVAVLDGVSHVHALVVARDGSLWIGHGDGVLRVPPERLAPLTTAARGTPPARLCAVGCERFGRAEGVGPLVRVLVEDDAGYVWAGTASGLLRLPRPAARSADERLPPAPLRFGTDDGLQSGDFSYPASPPVARAADGRLWMLSSTEIVVVDPRAVKPSLDPPPVMIESLRADGRPIALDPAKLVTLPAGTQRLEIAFTAVRFTAPQRVRFRSRLDGFDAHWSEPAQRRTIELMNLRPGEYVFRVQAAVESGSWGARDATVSFVRPPRLTETWWLRGLAVALVMGLVPGLVHVARVRRLKARFAALTAERNRIARDLHDTLEQSLTGVAMHLKAAEDFLAARDDRAAGEHVRSARAMTRHASTDARHAVWDLRGRGGRHADLPSALRQAVAQAEAASQLRGEVIIEGPVRALPADVETTLLRIAQEALTNVAKHAAARSVTVSLSFGERTVSLVVADDGRGMPDHPREGALGIVGMRERATWIGARLTLSAPGVPGAHVRVDVDVSAPTPGSARRDA